MNIGPLNNLSSMLSQVTGMLNQRAEAQIASESEIDRGLLRQMELIEELEPEEESQKLASGDEMVKDILTVGRTAVTLMLTRGLRDYMEEQKCRLTLYDRYSTLAAQEGNTAEEQAHYEEMRDLYEDLLGGNQLSGMNTSGVGVQHIVRPNDDFRGWYRADSFEQFVQQHLDWITKPEEGTDEVWRRVWDDVFGGAFDDISLETLGLAGYNDMSVAEQIEAVERAIAALDEYMELAIENGEEYFADHYEGQNPGSWKHMGFPASKAKRVSLDENGEAIEREEPGSELKRPGNADEYDAIVQYWKDYWESYVPPETISLVDVQELEVDYSRGIPIEKLYDGDGNITIIDMQPTLSEQFYLDSLFTHLDSEA